MKILSPIPSLIPAVVDSSEPKMSRPEHAVHEESSNTNTMSDVVMVDSAQEIQQDMMQSNDMEQKNSSQVMVPLDFVLDLCEKMREKLVSEVEIVFCEIDDCLNQVYEQLDKIALEAEDDAQNHIDHVDEVTDKFSYIRMLIKNKSKATSTKSATRIGTTF